MRQLVLVKKQSRWVFRYGPGQEQALIDWLTQAANDPQVEFDWFDAAVLSHQMGAKLSSQLKKIIPQQYQTKKITTKIKKYDGNQDQET